MNYDWKVLTVRESSDYDISNLEELLNRGYEIDRVDRTSAGLNQSSVLIYVLCNFNEDEKQS